MYRHDPNWIVISAAITARVLLVTALFTLLAFAAGLLLGILALAVRSAFSRSADFALAYRHFAVPGAFLGMFAGFVGMLVIELRQLRRPRTHAGTAVALTGRPR